MIEVTIKGLGKLSRFADQYPAISEKFVNTAISRSLLRILAQEKLEAPFGMSGILRDNWATQLGRFTGSIKALAPYAAYVHFGTRPHMPPVSAIEPWAKKHGLNPWAVAKSIAKKGTKANPFLQRAVDKTQAAVEQEFATALAGAMAEVNNYPDTI